jgi:arginyl-tRNA synthetase
VKFISPSLNIQTEISNSIDLVFQTSLAPSEIPINICYPKYDAHYTSPIALAISNQLGIDALSIAEAIVKQCSQNHQIASPWQIKVFGKGWLNICLSEQYMLSNIKILEDLIIEGIEYFQGFWVKSHIAMNDSKLPEPIKQYAYARCCALIRLAYRENLIPYEYQSEIINSSITTNQKFTDPHEISLYMRNLAIVEFLDLDNKISLVPNTPKFRSKLSRSLATSFLEFYDQCRIFGINREIAFKRLSLIRITQKLMLAIAPSEINYYMYL